MTEPTTAEIQARHDKAERKRLNAINVLPPIQYQRDRGLLLAENKRLRELVGKEAMRCTDPLNIEIPQYMCCNKHPWVLMTDKMGANLECPMCRAEAAEADYLESCRLHKETSRMLIDQQNRRKAAEATIARVKGLPAKAAQICRYYWKHNTPSIDEHSDFDSGVSATCENLEKILQRELQAALDKDND